VTEQPRTVAAPARTVYVIDDDASVRTALARLFRGAGLAPRTFASAEEFLQQEKVVRGCVVADVHLGRMNGLELQAALGRRAESIPVILISGVADAEMEREAMRLGALAFFRKPFDAGLLLDAVISGVGQPLETG